MKKHLPLFLLLVAATPSIASAQAGSFQNLFSGILGFIGSTLIPLLFTLAFLFFVINVIRYFVIGGSNEEAQESAKSLAIYGVGAFVFLIIFWGIVNLITSSIGLGNCAQPTSDYVNPNAYDPCGSAPASDSDGSLPFNALP